MKQTIKSILAFVALMLCGGAWAEKSISINFCQNDNNGSVTSDQTTAIGTIPTAAWNNTANAANSAANQEAGETSGGYTVSNLTVYDGSASAADSTKSVRFGVSGMNNFWYDKTSGSTLPGSYLHHALCHRVGTNNDGNIYFSNSGTDFQTYDVIVYLTAANANGKNPTSLGAVEVNGTWYKGDPNAASATKTVACANNDTWGEVPVTLSNGGTLGTTAIRVNGLTGALHIKKASQQDCGISAIQIVEVEPKHVGDVVTWSNTGTSKSISAADAKIGESQLNFKLPALSGLPVGSAVKIKKITFASPHTSFTGWDAKNSDGYAIKLNGVQSDWVNGASQASNAALSADKKIQSNSETSDFALEYTFSSPCCIIVGQNYAGGTGSGEGQGVAFLFSNSKVDYGSSTDYATCRYVQTGDAGSVCSVTQTTVDSGYYPVYEVSAEVVYVPSNSAPVSFDVDVANKPTTAKTAYVSSNMTAFSNDASYEQMINDKASTVVKVVDSSAAHTIFGGRGQNSEALLEKYIWLSVVSGSYDGVFGGSNCESWSGGTANSITGNIYVDVAGDATVNHIFGGNHKDGRNPTITGDINIVVRENAVVKGGITGLSVTTHSATTTLNGNTSITVKNVQSDNSANAYAGLLDYSDYIVGGGIFGTNVQGSQKILGGGTSVNIDIASGSGNFVKNIVGGSAVLERDTGYSRDFSVANNANITIKAPESVTFTGMIVAGGYKVNQPNANANVKGNATITVKGGSFGSTASFKSGEVGGTKALVFDADESVAPNCTINVSAAQIDSSLPVTVKSGTTLNLTVAASDNYAGTITVESGATLNLVSEEGVVHDLPATITGPGNVTKSGTGWISLSGVNTYTGTTVVKAGMIKAMTKNSFGTGHVSIANDAAQDAAIVVLAYDAATTFTLDSAATIVLTSAQIAGTFPLNTGVRSAADLQHTINNDSQQTLENLSFTLEDGIVVINTSSIPVHWDAEAGCWKDDQGNTVSEITGNYTIVLNDSDSVSIPEECGTSSVTLPESGRVSIANIGNFPANTVIYIPEATTLALVSHTKTSNVKFDGPGAIELSLDSSNATSNLSNNWLDNTNYVDSFSGRIVLIQGRFETAEILAARVAVEVRDGAQLSTGGTGEWNNHFILHGDGCEYERGSYNTSEAALRINNDLGSSAVLEFKQEDGDPKPVIGSHNHSATISAALKGTCGFKAVANENVTYTFKYNSASDLTGAVEFTNKVTPKLDFAGMSVGQQINLGTSFNVPAGKTLNLVGYQGSVVTTSTTDKPGVASTINLENGSSIYSDDGSFYLAGIGVAAGATANVGHKWAKGWVYGKLTVPADATLNFNLNTNNDGRDAMLAVKGGGNDCTGTINFNLSGGKKLFITTASNLNKAKAINLNGDGQTFAFQEFPAFNGATVTVNNGAILDVNGKCGDSGYASVKLNGGKLINSVAGSGINTTTLINKTWPVTTLTLEGDSSIGGTQSFGLVNGSWGATSLNLDTYTLTKEDNNHVVLCTTTINGTGTLDVTAGQVSIRADNKTSSAQNATIKVGTDAIFDIYNNQSFSVKNLLGNGGSFTTSNASGSYTVTGMLSGNGTFGRVTFADGATIDATSGTRTFSVTPTFAGAIKVKGTAGATILTLGDGVAAPTLPTNVTIIDDVGNEYVGASLVVEESAVKIGAIGAMAGGQVYADVATALAAVASTKSTVIPGDSAVEVPAEYADVYVKTTVGSTTIIRAKDALIDWKSTNGIDWDAFNDANHVYMTQDGYDTTYQDGDTICFVGDNTIQVYAKTATYGAKMQVGKDATHTGSVGFTRSGSGCNDSIIDGSSIEIKSGSKLHILRWGVGSTWNSYEASAPKFSQVKDSEIIGQGAIVIGKGATLLLKDTEATATIEFADNEQCEDDQLIKLDGTATLTVTEKLADDKVVSNDASKLVEFDAMTKIYALAADGSAVALSNASVGGDSMSGFGSDDTYSITIPISLVGADSTKVLVRYIDVATDKASTDTTIPNCLEIAELRSKPVAYTANGLATGKHRLRYEFEGLVLNCGQSYSVRVLNSSYSAFAARFLLRDCQNAGGATANAIIHDSKYSQTQANRYCITCEVTANLIVDKLAANYVAGEYASYGTADLVLAASKSGLIGLADDVELSPVMGDVLTYVKNGNAVTISNGQAYEETILGVTTAIIANRIIYQTSSTGYLCKSPCNHSPAHYCIDDAAKFYLSADGSGDAVVWQEGDVIVMTSMSGYYLGLGLVGKTFIIPSNQNCTLNQTGDTLSSFKNAKVYVLGSINQGTSTIRNSAFVLCGGSLTLTENYTGELSVIGNGTATKSNVALQLPFYGVNPETEEEVVITEEFESLELQPGANVKVPVGSDPAKISVKYGSTVLTGGDQPKVTVTINQETGKVELDVTAAAKPVVTEMTEADASNVSITFTPVAGLFYTLESGDTPDAFTSGTPEQATSDTAKTLQLAVPTGAAKVKFYRVSVKATK